MNTEEALEAVRREARRFNISKRQIAQVSGLHERTLHGFDRPNWNPTLNTLKKIEAAIATISSERE